MLRKTKSLWLAISVTVVNLLPYLLFIGIIQRTQAAVNNVLPFALFYTLRRTWPFLMRAVRHTAAADTLILYGLATATGGFLIGTFGQLMPLCWDVSGALIGISAAILPSVNRWQKQEEQVKKVTHQAIWQALGTLSILLLVSLTVHRWPAVAFLVMAMFPFLGLISYLIQGSGAKQLLPTKLAPISPIYGLFFGLVTISLLLVRLGRNTGQAQYLMLAELGLLMLFIAVAALVAIRQLKHRFKISRLLQLKMFLAGQLTDYIAVFSVLYLSVSYGFQAYSGIIIIYVLAAVLAQPITNKCHHWLKIAPYEVNLVGQLIGLAMMLIPYGYYFGVFIVRIFNSNNLFLIDQQVSALPSEVIPTRMYFRTRMTSIGGIFFQLILFGILGLQAKLTGQGLSAILSAYAFQHPTIRFQTTLGTTQWLVTGWLVLLILLVLSLNCWKGKEHESA